MVDVQCLRWERLDFEDNDTIPPYGQGVLAFPASRVNAPTVAIFVAAGKSSGHWQAGGNLHKAAKGDLWLEIPKPPARKRKRRS